MTNNFGAILRSIRRTAIARVALALLTFCLALGSPQILCAQSADQSGRKVVSSQNPDYPPVLKKAGIGGVVRLNAKVRADGTVVQVGVLGGNPILAECAVKAVMNWKYAPASATTNVIVSIDFNKR
ncbi:MAG: energy transducer TonB [Terriglobales bacterium]